MARSATVVAADELIAAGDHWRRTHQRWLLAVDRRDRVIALAERRVTRATGGFGLPRWQAACDRRRINTKAEALMVARAVRARMEVQVAVEEVARLRAAEEAALLPLMLELAEATKQLLGFGRLGRELSGMTPGELRRLARRPRKSPGIATG